MIYPARRDIRILQNATYVDTFRLLKELQSVRFIEPDALGEGIFNVPCHELTEDDAVVIVPNPDHKGPPPRVCGLDLNRVYYVAAAALERDELALAATAGGQPIEIPEAFLQENCLCIARPVDLTGYTADADLVDPHTGVVLASFDVSVVDDLGGLLRNTLGHQVTVDLVVGSYAWDLSLTDPFDNRFYYQAGAAIVERTFSRNEAGGGGAV